MDNKNDLMKLCDYFSDNLSEADIKKAHYLSEIASAITSARVALRMTQTEFAKYMDVTQGMVSKWENGDYNFTVEKLVDIFSKLNLDLDIRVLSCTSIQDSGHSKIVTLYPNKESSWRTYNQDSSQSSKFAYTSTSLKEM